MDRVDRGQDPKWAAAESPDYRRPGTPPAQPPPPPTRRWSEAGRGPTSRVAVRANIAGITTADPDRDPGLDPSRRRSGPRREAQTPTLGASGLRHSLLRDLDAADLARWRTIIDGDPTLSSPFFDPEYHVLIDAACRDTADAGVEGTPGPVEVVVARSAAGAQPGEAFFAFQRHRADPRIGVPSGQPLTDYQGIVADPTAGVPADPARFVRAAGLHTWRFDHVPVTQPGFAGATRTTGRSPVIDVADGFAAYTAANHAARKEQRGHRRLEREIGPVRFESHTEDPAVLTALAAWKSAQYRASGVTDLFGVPWCRLVFERVAATSAEHFRGTVSALWAGDQLVAAHLGLRRGPVWHYWIPAYDQTMRRHSPGTVLLLEMARWGAEHGVRVIDLGQGDQWYKDRLATGAVRLATGAIEVPDWRRDLKRLGRRAADRARRPRSTGSGDQADAGGQADAGDDG